MTRFKQNSLEVTAAIGFIALGVYLGMSWWSALALH
jgi:hypothetical protein